MMLRKLIGTVAGLALAGMVTAASVSHALTVDATTDVYFEYGPFAPDLYSLKQLDFTILTSNKWDTSEQIGVFLLDESSNIWFSQTMTQAGGSYSGALTFGPSPLHVTQSGTLLIQALSGSFDVGSLMQIAWIDSSGVIESFFFEAALAPRTDLSPIPIPAALPLFATALAGMGFVGWRRRRAA